MNTIDADAIRQYFCDACHTKISRKMHYNGLRIKGKALCLACQIVSNEKEMPEKLSKFINQDMIKSFSIRTEDIERSRNCEYFKK